MEPSADSRQPTARQATFEAAMDLALGAARAAGEHGDVPIGAVVVDATGTVVATAGNRREIDGDPTAHAEMLVIREAAARHGSWRLEGHTLVVTLEPCAMCAMAAVWARVDTIVFGAADPKAGAAWSLYNIPQDARLNHRCELVSGVLEDECAELLRDFFADRR
jgi:tRNA(adenine34) deaminase